MQITPSLNLVLPLRFGAEGEAVILGYHTPIDAVVFQANYRVIAAAKHAIFSKGLAFASESGPRIAALALRDAAKHDAEELGVQDTSTALLGELKRLTLVLAPTAGGYEQIPVDIAISRGVIDAEDWAEGESALVFFTCVYAMARKAARESAGKAAASVLGGLTTSSMPMEFAASLPTLTQEKTSAPAPTSSVPS